MSDIFDDGPTADGVSKSLAKDGMPVEMQQVDQGPQYQVRGDSKVAVSKARGKLWKSRKDACVKSMEDIASAWDDAISYYNNAQERDNPGDPNTGGTRRLANRMSTKYAVTENIVYSNVSAQVPELYSKNPQVTCTAGSSVDDAAWEAMKDEAGADEKLINVLMNKRQSPGINLKPKLKRGVLNTLLTNMCWFEIGYTPREESNSNAQQDLLDLSTQLTSAKDTKTIKEVEGKLIALEERIEFLRPAGAFVKLRLPTQVLKDPASTDPWLTDANWVIVLDALPTQYLNAVYGQKNNEKNEVRSIYEPTHILNGGDGITDEEKQTPFERNKEFANYGFGDKQSFDKAQLTAVAMVWDKTTRRLEMYATNDWTWPIWVWDDPYQLDGFFPITPLMFHEKPDGGYAKGEVSYYLDQQDILNQINDEESRFLQWIRRNIFFDPKVVAKEDVEKILAGAGEGATPINVPEGKDAKNLIFAIPPPSGSFAQFFTAKRDSTYKAIDRISASSEAMRGGEFKTNTTNQAIDYYSSQGNVRLDERLDAIEDCIADIGWKLLQLCRRFMDADEVKQLIGQDVSTFWKPLDPLTDFSKLAIQCVGGSSQKMSSKAKKQEAIQVGQVLQQYVKAAPASVLKISLQLFAAAFDDMQIRKEDWAKIEQEVAAQLAGGGPGAVMPGGAPGVGHNGGPPLPPDGGEGGAPPQAIQMIAQVAQQLQQLPPQMLQIIGTALAKGAPPMAIAQELIQHLQGGGAAPPGGPPQQGPPPANPQPAQQ